MQTDSTPDQSTSPGQSGTVIDQGSTQQEQPDRMAAPANYTKSETAVRNDSLFAGMYAPSGIDMMSILLHVYQRPNPKVELGAVDFNCAIIVCDTFAPDNPIIYCSQAFETLTGYQKHEIIGRNCRFLQTPYQPSDLIMPPSNVTSSSSVARKNIDHESPDLGQLKSHLERKEEAQVIITNYKKDGSPFQNILTTIPITWESDADELRYVVGFQVDQGTLI